VSVDNPTRTRAYGGLRMDGRCLREDQRPNVIMIMIMIEESRPPRRPLPFGAFISFAFTGVTQSSGKVQGGARHCLCSKSLKRPPKPCRNPQYASFATPTHPSMGATSALGYMCISLDHRVVTQVHTSTRQVRIGAACLGAVLSIKTTSTCCQLPDTSWRRPDRGSRWPAIAGPAAAA
jgi:hypothetical protein